MVFRTLVLACWLAAVLVHAEREPRTVLLALSLVALWTVALLRDRRLAHRTPGAQPL